MNSDWTTEVEREIAQYYGIDFECGTNDEYQEAIESVYKMREIQCPLYVWENGFEQGEASEAELLELATRLHLSVSELFETLNDDLRSTFYAILEKMAQ